MVFIWLKSSEQIQDDNTTKPSWLGQGKIRLHKHLEYYLIARRGNKNTSIMGVQVTKLLSVYFSKSHLSRFIMVWED
jgi:hypothetical protein